VKTTWQTQKNEIQLWTFGTNAFSRYFGVIMPIDGGLKHELDSGAFEQELNSSTDSASGSYPSNANDNRFKDISIVVTEKNNVHQNYGEFIELVYSVENNSDKNIKGIEGVMHVKDMFGKTIIDINWDVLERIPANSSKTVQGTGLDYNQFMDKHKKLYGTSFDSLVFEYEFKTIMYEDGASSNDGDENASSSLQEDDSKFKDIFVVVTEKNNVQQKYDEFIELVYRVDNNTDKDIKGIEGVMHVKDMFGKTVMDIGWDILESISANKSKTFKGMGIDYNQFMDTHNKLYSTSYDSLIFEYEFKTVIFTDGTTLK
jgi:recombinational DNA repair protein RecT